MKKLLPLLIFIIMLLVGCSNKPQQEFVDELNGKTDLTSLSLTDYTVTDSILDVYYGQVKGSFYLWQTDRIYIAEKLSSLKIFYIDVNSVNSESVLNSIEALGYGKIISSLLSDHEFSLDDFNYDDNTYTLKEEFINSFLESNGYDELSGLTISFDYDKTITQINIDYKDYGKISVHYENGYISQIDGDIAEDDNNITISAKIENRVIVSLVANGAYDGGYVNFSITPTTKIATSQLHTKEESAVSAMQLIKKFK